MARKLFRDEALQHQREKFWGEVLLTRPLSFTVLTLLTALAGLSILAYLVWGEYTRKVKVSGYLAPSAGIVKVAANEAGVVRTLVEEGANVRAGQTLAMLSLERDPGGEARQQQLRREIDTRRESLQQERSRVEATLAEQLRQLKRRETDADAEISALHRETQAQEERVAMLRSIAERNDKLSKDGFIATTQAQQRQSEYLEQAAKLETLRRQRVQLEREISNLRGEVGGLELKAKSQQGDVDRQLSALGKERVDTDDRKREIVIAAPVAGTVATRSVTLGQTLAVGAPLLTLLPAATTLRAELLVPTRAAGFVQAGQRVTLRYQAFPFERFGHAEGVIEEVGRAVLSPGDTGPLSLQEPVYRVVVRLAKAQVSAYGQEFALRSGMLLDADILLERRRLYEWLLEPLYAVVGRA